jgi:putative membrane protein
MIRGYSNHAANERTFLAWVRTGIAVIAFGFVIEKFNLFLSTIASGAVGGDQQRAHELASRPLGRYEGLAFMFGGVAIVALATMRFVRTTRLLDDTQTHSASNVRGELVLSTEQLAIASIWHLTEHSGFPWWARSNVPPAGCPVIRPDRGLSP